MYINVNIILFVHKKSAAHFSVIAQNAIVCINWTYISDET